MREGNCQIQKIVEVLEMVEKRYWQEVSQSVSTTRYFVGGLSSTHDEVEIIELDRSNSRNFRSIGLHRIF